ncbi:MAG: hypothetical protein WKF77_16955 [Planctomycetaceae bacterium]
MTNRTNRREDQADRQKRKIDPVDRPTTKDREEVRKQYTHRYASRKEPSHEQ